jgi:hypothetical protein
MDSSRLTFSRKGFCAVARASRFSDRLSLKQYLAASHIVVSTYAGVQTIPDKQLAAVGAKRSSCIRVPYFGVALQCLPGTELVLTLTTFRRKNALSDIGPVTLHATDIVLGGDFAPVHSRKRGQWAVPS